MVQNILTQKAINKSITQYNSNFYLGSIKTLELGSQP